MAIAYFFKEAYTIQFSKQMHPANEEVLSWKLTAILCRQGDDRFSTVLSKQSPETIAAVRGFIDLDSLSYKYIKTRKVLQKAPEILFPLDRLYRDQDG